VACSTCTYLERALKSRRGEYIVACSGAFRDVSSRLEAYGVVEMERARSDLAMHRSVCAAAITAAAAQPDLKAKKLPAAAAPRVRLKA
jgi:hypothetical protein